MSDRTAVLTVVLDDIYRTDDAEAIVAAIRMVKGVASVGINVADIETYTAYSKARMDLEAKLLQALKDPKTKDGGW